MATTDVTPVVARLKNRIETVTRIGPVYAHDVYAHDNLANLIVSDIAGERVMRAWWINGPTMTAANMTQSSTGHIERSWRYTICGIEGLSENGDNIVTLRTNALAVCDAIDVDRELNNTAHRTLPCQWRLPPENRVLWTGVAAAYIEIDKTVVTVSTP